MDEATKYRKQARQKLKGFWKDAFLISFFLIFITTMFYLLEYFTRSNTLLNLIVLLSILTFTIPLNYGYLSSLYKIRNMEKYSYFGFIKFAIKNFKKSWSIFANILLKILPLFIVFLIVTMVLAYGSTVIVNSNLLDFEISSFSDFGNLDSSIAFGVIAFTLGLISYFICIILFIPKFLLYSLSFFIGIKYTDISAKNAVEKSKELMKGNRIKLLILLVSFIFWGILTLVPYSIFMDILNLPLIGLTSFLLCYSLLMPYIMFSIIEFFEDRDSKNEIQIEQDPQN